MVGRNGIHAVRPGTRFEAVNRCGRGVRAIFGGYEANIAAGLQARHDRGSQYEEELVNSRQHQVIMSILEQLDERERAIITHRYGLEQGSEPLTLEEVGTKFGVTKERIRQRESRALQKLRKIAHEEKLDVPGL